MARLAQAVAGAAMLLCAWLFAFWKMGGVVPGIPAARAMGMLEVRGGWVGGDPRCC